MRAITSACTRKKRKQKSKLHDPEGAMPLLDGRTRTNVTLSQLIVPGRGRSHKTPMLPRPVKAPRDRLDTWFFDKSLKYV